jgi:hypothetical protein
MRAKEFILKEDILNEGIIDKIKTIYNIITKEPQFIKKVKEVQQNTSLINSIVQSLKTKASDTPLTKEDVITIIQSKLPTMENDIKEPNNWRRSKLAGIISLIAVGITSIIRFVGGPAADGNSAVEITGISTVIILAISLLVVFIDVLRNHPKTVGLLSAAGLAALIALVPPAPSDNASTPEISNAKFMGAASSKEEIIYNMAGELYNMRMQRIPLVSAEKYIKEKYQGKQLKMANAVLDYIYAYSPETLAMIKDPEELQQQIRRNVANYY